MFPPCNHKRHRFGRGRRYGPFTLIETGVRGGGTVRRPGVLSARFGFDRFGGADARQHLVAGADVCAQMPILDDGRVSVAIKQRSDRAGRGAHQLPPLRFRRPSLKTGRW